MGLCDSCRRPIKGGHENSCCICHAAICAQCVQLIGESIQSLAYPFCAKCKKGLEIDPAKIEEIRTSLGHSISRRLALALARSLHPCAFDVGFAAGLDAAEGEN